MLLYTSAGLQAHRDTEHGIAATELVMHTVVQDTGGNLTEAVLVCVQLCKIVIMHDCVLCVCVSGFGWDLYATPRGVMLT